MMLRDDDPELKPEDHVAIRHAMLSVYYHSLGRQWQQQGAPAVMLPPEVRPLELSVALAELESRSPSRWRDAIWRVVRAAPLNAAIDQPIDRRYPPALLDLVGRQWLLDTEQLRRAYRSGANLFAAAMDSIINGRPDEATELMELMARHIDEKGENFNAAVQGTMELTARGMLDAMGFTESQRIAKQLPKLEAELGQNTQDFVLDFADSAAFQRKVVDLRPGLRRDAVDGQVTVSPVSSAISQDSANLTTTATVTTLVKGPFATLSFAVDPRSWALSSDVIRSARYVADAFSFADLPEPSEIGSGKGEPRLVHEVATVSWGADDDQQGTFDVVLNTSFKVDEDDETVSLRFSLGRSISSRILWDRRTGGIVVDGGYILVRPLTPGFWRVTSRKVLRFSDRTPELNGRGWLDTGQMLNYLAPAALTWWIESETYSLESKAYSELRGAA